MKTKNLKRLLSLLLCLCMVAGLLPATALAVTPDGSVSAAIYLDNGDGRLEADEKKTTFAADQAGLILHLDDFNTAVPKGWTVDSIAFYPENAGENKWGTVFWYSGGDNGTSNDKLYVDGQYNGVFQIINFTPNGGGMGLEPGTYKVLVYAGYSNGDSHEESSYLSNESFTITKAAGPVTPSDPVINTTTLPNGIVGTEYSQTLSAAAANGGDITWSITAGSLPDGLSLNGDTITGTPKAAGSYTFTVQASEAGGGSAAKQLTITIGAAPVYTLEFDDNRTFCPGDLMYVSLGSDCGFSGDVKVHFNYIDRNDAEKTTDPKKMVSSGINAWLFVSVPDGAKRITKVTVTVGGKTAAEKGLKDVTISSKLTVNIGSPAAKAINLHVKQGTGEIAGGYIPAGSSEASPFYLNAGDYTITADVDIWGGRTLDVTDGSNTVTLNAGVPTATALTLKDMTSTTVTPTVTAESKSYSDYKLQWYYKDGDTPVVVSADNSFSILACDDTEYYVKAIPLDTLTTTHDSVEVKIDKSNPSPDITMPKKKMITVTGTLPRYGTVTVSRPGGNGTYQGEGIWGAVQSDSAYTYSVQNITMGTRITYTPYDGNYAPQTVIVDDLTVTEHNFTDKAAEGLITISNTPDLRTAGNGGLWSMSGLTVKKGDTDVPFHIVSDTALMLDGDINAGDTFSFSAAGGESSEYPEYVYTGAITLGVDKNCKMSLETETRGQFCFALTDVQQATAVLIYDDAGNICAQMKRNRENSTGFSPYLSKTEYYTFCAIPQSLLDTMTPEEYDTMAELPDGKYIASGRQRITDSDRLILTAPPVESGVKAVNTGASSLVMSEAYSDSVSIDLNVAVLADAEINPNRGVNVILYTNQTGAGGNVETRSMTVNGFPIETSGLAVENSGKLTLNLTGEELQQYGGFPLHVAAIIGRGDYHQMKVDAYLTYTHRVETMERKEYIASYNRIADRITLEAPLTVNEKVFTVYGNAVRNTAVDLYINGVSVTKTTSANQGGGFYSAQITLPSDVKDGDVFIITAKADNTVSEPVTVVYDAAAASLKKVTFCYSEDFRDSNPEKIVIWDNGKPISPNSSYPIINNTYVWWEIEFNNPDKLATTVRKVISTDTYETVPNVTVTVPVGTETVELLARKSENGDVFKTVPYIFPGGTGPVDVYVSYFNEYDNSVTITETTAGTSDLLDLLNGSEFISNVSGTDNDIRFTLDNGHGKTIPVLMTVTQEAWDENEIATLNDLNGYWVHGEDTGMSGGGSTLFYQEGYLPSADAYWGVESINKYPIAGSSGEFLYVWEIYTKTQRTVVTWNTRDRKKGTTITALGGDDERKQVDPALSETERTQLILDVWTAFTQQLNTALNTPKETANFHLLSNDTVLQATRQNGGGTIFDKIGKLWDAKEKGQTYVDNANTAVNAFQEGVPMSASEMRKIKDVLDRNPELVRTAQMYESSGGENPLQGVVDAYNAVNGKLGETFVNTVNTYGGIATGGATGGFASAAADAVKGQAVSGFFENVGAWFGGKPRQADTILENLDKAMLVVEGGGFGDLIPNGVDRSKMPKEYQTGLNDRKAELTWEEEYDLWLKKHKAEMEQHKKEMEQSEKDLEQLKKDIDELAEEWGYKGKLRDDTTRTNGEGKTNGQKMSVPKALQDPSGYIYEAVPSNRVEGAAVQLYLYDGGAVFADIDDLGINEPNPQTTGADGRYQWFVPEGYWQVRVSKDGYTSVSTGDSGEYGLNATKNLDLNGDGTAETSASDYWMPVLPVQLDVNIPLVSLASPTVEEVKAAEDGVYITFTKYMESDLTTSQFRINGLEPTAVTPLNEEAASAADGAPTYASVFKLGYPTGVEANNGDTVSLLTDSSVTAYNGKTLGVNYTNASVTVTALEKLPTPRISPVLESVLMNTLVTLESAEWNSTLREYEPTGADIYYTTDGTAPTTASTRYTRSIAISGPVTIKAIAVKPGMADSDVLTASYTVVTAGSGNENPPTPPASGGGGGGGRSTVTYAVNVPKASTGGSITVSPKTAAKGDTVTITVTPDNGYELEKLTVTDSKGNEVKLTAQDSGKYTFTMPDSKVEIKASFKPAETITFTDVAEGAYYYDAVLWAAEQGITDGTGDGTTFSPDAPCTRAQIVTFLWRAAGSPEPKSMNSFSDVSADAYYAKAVAWAMEQGITGGTGNGKFSPDATCTRSQSAAFLYRAAGSPAVSGDAAFSDVSADAYYADAVAWAEQNGVTNGIGGGLFGSGNDCTRAQIVTFLYRAYQGE